MARVLANIPLVLHVNPALGSNTNDGLMPSTALKTLQWAHDYIIKSFDLNGMPATIQAAAGYSYTEKLQVYSQPVGHHLITLRGDPANPGDYRWIVGAGESICSVTDYGCVQLDGWELSGTANSIGLTTSQQSIGDMQHCMIGSFEGGTVLKAEKNSLINITGPNILAGSCGIFGQATTQSRVYLGGQSFSIPYAGIRVGDAMFSAIGKGMIDFGGQVIFSGAGVTGTTGKAWDAQFQSLILMGGTIFPSGMTTGTCDSTSQIA